MALLPVPSRHVALILARGPEIGPVTRGLRTGLSVEFCVSFTARVDVVKPLLENSALNVPDCKLESEYAPSG